MWSIWLSRLFYLQAGEAVALVAGQLCIDEFSEKKLSELWTLKTGKGMQSLFMSCLTRKCLSHLSEDGWGRKGWAKHRYIISCCDGHLSITEAAVSEASTSLCFVH